MREETGLHDASTQTSDEDVPVEDGKMGGWGRGVARGARGLVIKEIGCVRG